MNRLDTTFAALADPTRRSILRRLSRGDATVGELAGRFPISPPAISRHLRVLEEAGLVRRERVGRQQRIRLHAPPLRRAEEWIERYRSFWDERLEDLGRFLEDESG